MDAMEEHFIDANERMGEALVQIGMALGLPRPTAQYSWGAPEILARISDIEAEGRELLAERDGLRTSVFRLHQLCDEINGVYDSISVDTIKQILPGACPVHTEEHRCSPPERSPLAVDGSWASRRWDCPSCGMKWAFLIHLGRRGEQRGEWRRYQFPG